jgi:hypothetical protein
MSDYSKNIFDKEFKYEQLRNMSRRIISVIPKELASNISDELFDFIL